MLLKRTEVTLQDVHAALAKIEARRLGAMRCTEDFVDDGAPDDLIDLAESVASRWNDLHKVVKRLVPEIGS